MTHKENSVILNRIDCVSQLDLYNKKFIFDLQTFDFTITRGEQWCSTPRPIHTTGFRNFNKKEVENSDMYSDYKKLVWNDGEFFGYFLEIGKKFEEIEENIWQDTNKRTGMFWIVQHYYYLKEFCGYSNLEKPKYLKEVDDFHKKHQDFLNSLYYMQ